MDLIRIYRCLGDETRVRILHLLTRESLCVSHLQIILKLPQVTISKSLACLRKHGMVQATRREQWMIYSLPRDLPLEFSAQLKCLRECVNGHRKFQDDLTQLRKISDAVKEIVRHANVKRKSRRRDFVQTPVFVPPIEHTNAEEAFPDHLK